MIKPKTTLGMLAVAVALAIGVAGFPAQAGLAATTPTTPVTTSPSVSTQVSPSGQGLTASFTVTYSTATAGIGYVLFGAGPGCTGLIGTATEDTQVATNQHTIVVTGNQVPGTFGAMPVIPGATYYFEVVTQGSTGTTVDNNGGTCYSVTVPSSTAVAGTVYTETNSSSGNSVLVLQRHADGLLSLVQSVPTGGMGSGFFLDSQGSVTLSSDGKFVFAVNAGDNTVSSFLVTSTGLTLVSTVSSNGGYPESVTSHGNLVYVANESATTPFSQLPGPGKFVDAAGNMSGYTVDSTGKLTPIAGSVVPTGKGTRQIGFNPDGTVLVVTNRTDNNIQTFPVSAAGVPGTPTTTASTSPSPFGPFGFAFDSTGHLFVADSNTAPSFSPNNPAGASSYSLTDAGAVTPITGFVANQQQITCWMVVDGKYAYTTNAIGLTPVSSDPHLGPGTISSYTIGADGSLTLLQPIAASLPGIANLPGHLAVDEFASGDGKWLYVLDISFPPDAPNGAQIDAFAVHSDGTLTFTGTTGPLPGGPGFSGLIGS